MRFWQKAFVLILLAFLLSLDFVAIFSIHANYRLSEQAILKAGEGEANAIQQAIEQRLEKAANYYTAFTTTNLSAYLGPYGRMYQGQQTYLQIRSGDLLLYSSFPDNPSAIIIPNNPVILTIDKHYYLVIQRLILTDFGELSLAYIKNADSLFNQKEEMLRTFLQISIGVGVPTAALLLALLLRLTAPIRSLNEAAARIAGGDYQGRVTIHGHDEISALGKTFNQMTDAVKKHVATLESMTEERQRFVDSMAHELRTPITAIMGYGEVLRFAITTDEEKDMALTYIIDQSKRIKSLSEKLMRMASLQHEEITRTPVSLRRIAGSAKQSLQKAFDTAGVSLLICMEDITVQGDTVLLETLLLNLLENALRASSSGQSVLVQTIRKDGVACLLIKDEGIGIAPQAQAHIMEPFYRVDPSRSRMNGGAGLGLSLCKQICDLHGASLTVDSMPNRGTIIRIEFTFP